MCTQRFCLLPNFSLSAYLSHISDDGLLYNSHINKYILLLGKDNLSKYKMKFLNSNFI